MVAAFAGDITYAVHGETAVIIKPDDVVAIQIDAFFSDKTACWGDFVATPEFAECALPQAGGGVVANGLAKQHGRVGKWLAARGENPQARTAFV